MKPDKTIICLVCPRDCELLLSEKEDTGGETAETAVMPAEKPIASGAAAPLPPPARFPYSIRGNKCKRGLAFAIRELTAPARVLTTTVAVEGGTRKRLPVRSSAPVPVALTARWLEQAKQLRVCAPVAMGEVLAADVLGTGISVLAARSIGTARAAVPPPLD